MVATRKDSAGAPKKLRFNDKLVGKGLSSDGLLKKLKNLQSELADLDQDDADKKSLAPICKELISHSILLHKDKGVKAYAACCLADVLRLFVPDAPYTDQELQDIFQFFFRQLSIGLKGASDAYYDQYFYLLESLATIKSIVLVCDLPQTEDLTTTLFREFFSLVRHQVARNIEMFIVECMIAIIDEAASLPHEVLEIIMAQFMDKNASMDQPAYRVSVEVCKATSDRLQRNVCQYFTDNIVQHAQAENYEELGQCHVLIRRLNAACPALLLNVIPQLEEELRVDDVQIRVLSTQALGSMFADSVGGDLEKKYHSTWMLWLSKKNDRSTPVRLAFIDGCKGLLTHHRAEVREEIEESVQNKCMDPDEKVRAAVCKMIGSLDYDTALHHVSEDLIQAIGERSMDKKSNVREEALRAIGRLYSLAYSAIENNEKHVIQHFGWIPSQILKVISSSAESNHVILQVFSEYINPLPSKGDDEGAWTERLLTVMQHLESSEIPTLRKIMNLRRGRPPLELYVNACANNNGGIIDENEDVVKRNLANVIKAISVDFPEPHKAVEDLQAFADMNEQRLYKLLRTCMDPLTDLKGLVKATNDFTRRMEQSSPSLLSTMLVLLRKSSYWIVNTSSIPTLVKKIQKSSSDTDKKGKGRETTSSQLMAHNARMLLTAISKNVPEMHRPHLTELVKAITDDKNPRLVECCLQALAFLVKNEPALTPIEKKTVERLDRLARGSNPRQAKYATWTLAFHEKRESLCKELVEFVAEDLQACDVNILAARLACLKEIVRFAPNTFELKSDVITEFLVKEVLMRSSLNESDDMEVDDDWAEMEDLPPLAEAKVLAIKVCRHRCLALAKAESDDIVRPVLNMLVTLLNNEGAMPATLDMPSVKSRLRLEAAISVIHLSTVEKFFEAISPHFLSVAFMIQDVCYEVREGFLNKLLKLMSMRKLNLRFNIIPFLTAHDPAAELRDKAKNFVLFQFRRSSPEIRLMCWETPFLRLLHALAHHPDFGLDEERVVDMAKYVQLYLLLVASADNISLLYHLAQKCKTVRDADSHTYSENLYAMSELAQELVKAYAKARQWSLQSYPGKVKLPADIFRGLPSEAARTSILKTQYLADHFVNVILENTSTTAREKAKIEKKPPAERKHATKRKSSLKATNGKKRQRRPVKSRKHNKSDGDSDEESSSGGHSGLEDDPISESEKENKSSISPSRGTRRSARAQAAKKLKSES